MKAFVKLEDAYLKNRNPDVVGTFNVGDNLMNFAQIKAPSAPSRYSGSGATRLGRLRVVYKNVEKYARKWRLAVFPSYHDFRDWVGNVDGTSAYADEMYTKLYDAWKRSNFSKDLAPVVVRKHKKAGFVATNLEWRRYSSAPWWLTKTAETFSKRHNAEMAAKSATYDYDALRKEYRRRRSLDRETLRKEFYDRAAKEEKDAEDRRQKHTV